MFNYKNYDTYGTNGHRSYMQLCIYTKLIEKRMSRTVSMTPNARARE
jgi:hypothetical protein